jgi:hypothetical protein
MVMQTRWKLIGTPQTIQVSSHTSSDDDQLVEKALDLSATKASSLKDLLQLLCDYEGRSDMISSV